jgi:prepilin-type N-terminal cleavage/methylation domain-containing protein
MGTRRSPRAGGFTLIELLVVIFIILLVSIATLPIILPALYHRQVSEGARILQANLVSARDAAVKANAPRGIRLILDYQFNTPPTLAASQIIPIELGPDYNVGHVNIDIPEHNPASVLPPFDINDPRIGFQECKTVGNVPGLPNEPTSWFWNIRQGDQIRFGDAGRYYTIAGPMLVGTRTGTSSVSNPTNVINSDRFINFGAPTTFQSLPTNAFVEFMFVVNQQDDDGDGWVDESFDGIDNDGDGVTDPGFDGIDNDNDGVVDNWQELFWSYGPMGYNAAKPWSGEYERETFVGPQFGANFTDQKYTILRRPVPTQGARAVALPSDVVIDLTTSSPFTVVNPNQTITYPNSQERSRLPVDPLTGYVDIMIAPNGQVVQAGAASNQAPLLSHPFYHFWIAERSDVHEPLVNPNANGINQVPQLPMPRGTVDSTGTVKYPSQGERDLKGERRLVTLFTRTGLVITSSATQFSPTNVDQPFFEAQSGQREVPQ